MNDFREQLDKTIRNPIAPEYRDTWAHLKWEYMEQVQANEPNLWLGWYDLVSVVPISPTGEMYVEHADKSVREDSGS